MLFHENTSVTCWRDFIEKQAPRLSQKLGQALYPPLVVEMSGFFILDFLSLSVTSHKKKKKPPCLARLLADAQDKNANETLEQLAVLFQLLCLRVVVVVVVSLTTKEGGSCACRAGGVCQCSPKVSCKGEEVREAVREKEIFR